MQYLLRLSILVDTDLVPQDMWETEGTPGPVQRAMMAMDGEDLKVLEGACEVHTSGDQGVAEGAEAILRDES